MLFGVISSIQNWHAKYNVAHSGLEISFLGVNTSFTLTFNSVALIIYWNLWKLKEIAGKETNVLCLFDEKLFSNLGAG